MLFFGTPQIWHCYFSVMRIDSPAFQLNAVMLLL